MNTAFWWGNLFENDNLEDRERDERITLMWIKGDCFLLRGGMELPRFVSRGVLFFVLAALNFGVVRRDCLYYKLMQRP